MVWKQKRVHRGYLVYFWWVTQCERKQRASQEAESFSRNHRLVRVRTCREEVKDVEGCVTTAWIPESVWWKLSKSWIMVCCWNSVSVHQCWIETQRQSFGWVEKTSFYCFARQRGPLLANACKTVCPALEGVVKSLIMFKEQGVVSSWTFFWLVGGEVIRSQHHQPSGSNQCGGLCACGQQTVNFLHQVGVSVSAKQLKGHGSEYYP